MWGGGGGVLGTAGPVCNVGVAVTSLCLCQRPVQGWGGGGGVQYDLFIMQGKGAAVIVGKKGGGGVLVLGTAGPVYNVGVAVTSLCLCQRPVQGTLTSGSQILPLHCSKSPSDNRGVYVMVLSLVQHCRTAGWVCVCVCVCVWCMRETSDGLLYFGHRPIYIYIQTAKYKTKLCTQTDKYDIQTAKHTDKQDKYQQQQQQQQQKKKKKRKKKSRQNSHTEIMRHYGGI